MAKRSTLHEALAARLTRGALPPQPPGFADAQREQAALFPLSPALPPAP